MKDIYIKFGKPLNGKEIKGESRDAGAGTQHAAPWFEAISWNHVIRQPKSATASTAGGHTAERCEHGEMIFTKDLDLVSPQLWEACSAGTLYDDVESEGLPTESFGLRYSAVEWTYTQQTMDGKSKPGQVAAWSLATNKAAFDAPN